MFEEPIKQPQRYLRLSQTFSWESSSWEFLGRGKGVCSPGLEREFYHSSGTKPGNSFANMFFTSAVRTRRLEDWDAPNMHDILGHVCTKGVEDKAHHSGNSKAMTKDLQGRPKRATSLSFRGSLQADSHLCLFHSRLFPETHS